MNFFILQTLKSHMLADFKNVGAVVFKYFFKMLDPDNTEIIAISNKLQSQFQNLLIFFPSLLPFDFFELLLYFFDELIPVFDIPGLTIFYLGK